MLSGRSKTTMPVLTSHACDQTWVAGSTTSIIESLLVFRRLVPRANKSGASRGNGRGASYVERRLRLTAAPRERAGCSPACLPPEGTSWPSSRCTDASTSPGSAAGALPRRAFAVDCTCSEVMFRGGLRAVVRPACRTPGVPAVRAGTLRGSVRWAGRASHTPSACRAVLAAAASEESALAALRLRAAAAVAAVQVGVVESHVDSRWGSRRPV